MHRHVFAMVALLGIFTCTELSSREPGPSEQFLEALGRGDLAAIKKLAATVKKSDVPNLPYQAPMSPNAEVVEFLRTTYDLNISDLQIAAIRGDSLAVQKILAKLDDESKAGELARGYTHNLMSNSPLTLAVRHGHTAVVRELIAAKANVNEYGVWTLTPLANAAENGHDEIVKMLLMAGALVDAAPDAYTPLMRACIGGKPKTTKMLLEAGADPNAAHDDGQRPLHFAAKSGSVECVKLLLAHGATPRVQDDSKSSPLTYAELYKHGDIVSLLSQVKPD